MYRYLLKLLLINFLLIISQSKLLSEDSFENLLNEFRDKQLEAKEILRIKDMLNKSMAEMTGQTFEKIEKDTDRDYFLSAEEAKNYGLIDRVITHPSDAT